MYIYLKINGFIIQQTTGKRNRISKNLSKQSVFLQVMCPPVSPFDFTPIAAETITDLQGASLVMHHFQPMDNWLTQEVIICSSKKYNVCILFADKFLEINNHMMTILSVCLTNLGKFNRIENTHNIENSFKYFKSLLGRIKYGNKICN